MLKPAIVNSWITQLIPKDAGMLKPAFVNSWITQLIPKDAGMLKPAFVNSWITHSLRRPKEAVHCPVYSMLWKERENGARVWPLCKHWNLLHSGVFSNSERATISFYVQTPNEVVNRNSVACNVLKYSIESGSLHV